MDNFTSILLKVVVSIVVALIGKYVVPTLKTYMEKLKNDQIFDIVETAVRAAEQTVIGHGKGDTKKKKVIELAVKRLSEKNINIDSKDLDQFIEECVYLLKNS